MNVRIKLIIVFLLLTRLFPLLFFSFACTSLKQNDHKGLADPTGWPLLCMSLIKHSFLIGAPPSSPPLASFYSSHFPVMHSGLINYSGVYRSAGSVFLSSSVLTYRYTWLSILYSGADPLFVFVLMKGWQMTFWLCFYFIFFLTWWLSPVFSRKRECGYYFDVERGAQRCSHYPGSLRLRGKYTPISYLPQQSER